MKSQSIPIGKVIPRTPSEVQLCMDEAIAEERDYMFFCRLVQGISQTQESSRNMYLRYENEACLAHVYRTRHDQQQKPLYDNEDFTASYVPKTLLPQTIPPTGQFDADEWAPGLSGLEVPPHHHSTPSMSYVDSITTKALAIAESDDDDDDDAIFELEL